MNKVLGALLILFSLHSFGTELTFHDVRRCTKKQYCFDKVIKKGTQVTLIKNGTSENCIVTAGKNYSFVSKPIGGDPSDEHYGEKTEFQATEILSSSQCGDLEKFYLGITGVEVKNYSKAEVKVVSNKKEISKIDKIFRDEDFIPTLSLSPSPIYDLKKLIEISYKNRKIDIAIYEHQNLSTNQVSEPRVGILVGKKVFSLPTGGWNRMDDIFAYEINDRMFFNSSAVCAECDVWSGIEIFEVTTDAVKRKHTRYD